MTTAAISVPTRQHFRASIQQQAAAHLGRCCLFLEAMETRPATEISRELRQQIGEVEHLPSVANVHRNVPEPFCDNPKAGNLLRAFQHLSYSLYLIRSIRSEAALRKVEWLSPYLGEISRLAAVRARVGAL